MIKTLIAIPCMSMVHTDFMISFTDLDKPEGTRYMPAKNTLIYDARNGLAANAITNEFDRVLWLDSDMKFNPDLLTRLSDDMDQGLDFVSGLYFGRKLPMRPVIYKTIEWAIGEDGKVHSKTERMMDYPHNDIFEIQGSGFGCVMTSTKLLREVWEKFGSPFQPLLYLGEDLSFCYRVKQLGVPMYCDSRVKAGHVGEFVFDEASYITQEDL